VLVANFKIAVLLVLPILGWLACGDEAPSADELALQEMEKDTTLYRTQQIHRISLNPKAREFVEDWPIFQDFETELSSLDRSRLDALKTKSEKLLAHSDSLAKHIPDTLFSNAIQSRLTIVRTQIHLLQQEVNKGNPNTENIERSLNNTLKSVNNFIQQINEKIQKDQIDLQRRDNEKKELEKQKKAMDSIYQLELQDQN